MLGAQTDRSSLPLSRHDCDPLFPGVTWQSQISICRGREKVGERHVRVPQSLVAGRDAEDHLHDALNRLAVDLDQPGAEQPIEFPSGRTHTDGVAEPTEPDRQRLEQQPLIGQREGTGVNVVDQIRHLLQAEEEPVVVERTDLAPIDLRMYFQSMLRPRTMGLEVTYRFDL